MLRSQTSIPSKNPAKPLAIDQKDLEQFIGILYVTSPVKMPSTGLYWNSEFYFEKVAQVMTINCFEFIKSNLHCNDNLKCPPNCEDKLYNLRPLIDHFQEKFSQIIPSEKLCIDELMVPFKGKSHLNQCNPQTPKKWGYKIYVLSRIDGIIYNFKIHTGSIMPYFGQPDLQASGNIVLQLVQHIPHFQWYKLYFDNWYTSVLLEKSLHEQGIATVGTVRSNRLYNCKLSDDKSMKKKGRWSTEIWVSSVDNVELRAVKSFDNRGVTLLSTYESVEPTKNVERFYKQASKYVRWAS